MAESAGVRALVEKGTCSLARLTPGTGSLTMVAHPWNGGLTHDDPRPMGSRALNGRDARHHARPARCGRTTDQLSGRRTSQDELIRFEIQKRDSGRRFLRRLTLNMTLTCEDASTVRFGIGGFGDGQRLGDDGSFGVHELYTGIFGVAIDIEGSSDGARPKGHSK